MPDTNTIGSTNSDLECLIGDTLYNNTSNALTVDVVRVTDVATGTWYTAFCLDVCYLPTKDSVRFTLQPNEHQGMIVHFYTDSTAACGDVYFKFKNVNTPSNVFYQWFHACSQLGFGINENNTPKADVVIYPMPLKSGEAFTMGISKVQTRKSLLLEVYNIFGSKVYQTNVIGGTNPMKLNLPSGVYSYSLISDNSKLNAGKIVIAE
jgi:hypothetical protein